MNLSIYKTAKRNITLAIILLLTASYCGCFDVSFYAFNEGGSISASSCAAISHSLLTCSPSDVRRDAGADTEHEQSYERSNVVSEMFRRIVRKLRQIPGGSVLSESVLHFKYYFIYICTLSCALLFLLTHIRFIHLKDGSK